MFHRDTFRLIRKTGKRFVAILLIVLIGVGFMVGLMSSSPTMRASVDRYFDDYNFMDVQLYSACGFDEGDVAALAANDVVKDIFATKFTDVYVKNDESVIITRVQELESDINRFMLLEGRMPQKPNEALALGSSSYGTVFFIGDKIELYLEEDDLSENLAVTEYEIVGTVKTPQYMSDSKETSTLNNLNLSTVIFVDNENFLSEYYTSLYLTIKGADEFDSFGDEYEQFIGEKLDELQKTIDIQEPVLKEKIIKEATEEIADGERELEEEVAEAEAEIADAKKELEDAYYRIMYGESQLQSGEKALKEGEKEISKSEKLLDKSEKELNAGKQQLAQQTGTTYEEAAANIKNFYGIYNMLKGMAANPEIPAGAAVSQVLAGQTAQVATLQGYNQQLADGNTALESYNSQLEQQNSLLNEEIRRLTEENNSLSPDTEGYADIIAANSAKISENQTAVASNTETINQNKSTISSNNTLIEQNNTYIRQLSQIVTVLENMLTLFGDVPFAQLPAMIDGMFGGSMDTAYQSVLTIEQGDIQIADGRQQLKKAKNKLSDSKKQLRDAAAELNEGRAEYEKGVKELADAEKELAEEVEEARIDIEKAKQDLAELPDAEWTVLDRESHYSTVMYSGNTDQMERIGSVFPMLFFLVAALVCMTTMKRLVDEERSQIGIFSALGFSKKQITGKYVIYALSASLIGSVVSIPLGVNIFPVVIYYCWRLTYDLPDMVLTMPAEIALLGVCSFTVLMVMVTIMVVHGVLRENPSRLMRPKAPRSAKKIFIEHIDFIWKRLSFTSKVTARNIIRYKSRFFMTVIGVAGCTSLLVLGFAIKGSISQVITLQYEDIINYDTTISLEDDDYLAEIRNDLIEDERVNAVIPFMTYSSKVYFEDDDKAIQSYVMKAGEVHGAYDLRDRKTKD
ncbi:MAG: ABC transporter permease, partial [Oscillospiraceae bacterium]|nr:ABC transporter permease [Oscillospiraceae bacterium]